MKAVITFIAVSLFCLSAAHAQSRHEAILESCPGYLWQHPITSDLNWSVTCFLQAIRDKNKALAVAIAPAAKCLPVDPAACVDGIMDEPMVDLFFGDVPGHSTSTSFNQLIAATDTVVVTYDIIDRSNGVQVYFLVAPEKRMVNFVAGRMKDFFDCHFSFNEERNMWLMEENITMETDDYDESREIDLSGDSSALPAMIWKPKK